MMSWDIGAEQGFSFSLGKNYKFIERYLPEQDWQKLLSTYSESSYENMWQSLFTCHELFRKYAKAVSKKLGYPYPNYDEVITKYTEEIYHSLK
jgi:aminoglycoside 6-adenylyltransferase